MPDKEKEIKKISIEEPDILDERWGESRFCPNCGGVLKRECKNYKDHYYQVGIRCTKCYHFEGVEGHFDLSDGCLICGCKGLCIGECKKNSSDNTYEVRIICLNCGQSNILEQGNFSEKLALYLEKSRAFVRLRFHDK